MVTTIKKPADAPASDQAGADSAGFADLVGQAEMLDGSAPGAPGTSIQTAAPDPVEKMAHEIFALLKLPRNLAQKRFAWWPEFGLVWSDDQLQTIAAAFANLCNEMGWQIDDLTANPWVIIAAALGVPCFVTWDAVQDRRAQLAADQARQRQQTSNAPAANGNAQ